MNNAIYCKAGNVELSKTEAFRIYFGKLYVCTHSAVYQPHFHQAQPEQQISFTKIIQLAHGNNIAKRGRFYVLNARQINELLGKKMLIEEQEE